MSGLTAGGLAHGWDCHVHVFDAAAPTAPGHYQPAAAPLDEIEALAAAHGQQHLVLVQPSVYGSDNAVLLQALQRTPGRHRGVAVVDADVTDAQLDAMHAAGVRGIRFNLVSPVGNHDDALHALAPRLAARRWHVQWYARHTDLPRLARLQPATGLTFVLDHLAGIPAGLPPTDPAWEALAELARGGAWVKLSGWYRLGASAPYDDMAAAVARIAGLFDGRLVWGSDWPHTTFKHRSECRYDALLEPVRQALGEATLQRVLTGNAQWLYA